MEEHKSGPVQHTPVVQPHKSNVVSILVAVSLVVSLISLYGIFSLHSKLNTLTGNAVNVPGNTNVPPAQLPGTIQPVQVSVDDDAVEGSKDAPVTIVEFSDFQCPFCGRFYQETLPQLRENYVKTGKVKIVYRDFPLPFHENAQKAAEASECAHEQGKFWQMHDMMFSHQDAITVANLKQYAKSLGLDTTKFNQCLDSGKYASEVQKDETDGSAYGVGGTPTFFINGQQLVGAQPYQAFQQAIDAALAK